MKKVLLLCLLSVFMFSCGGDSPKSVAESFSKELAKGNIDKAKKYCTEETGNLLAMMASYAPDDVKNEEFEFNFVREEIDEDKATVYYTDENGDEEEVHLTKVDGKWKVVMSK